MSTKTTRSGCNNLRPLIATRVSPRCKAPHLMRLAQTRHRTSGQECKKGVACVTMIHATNSCRLNSSREFRLIQLYLPPPPPPLSLPQRANGVAGAQSTKERIFITLHQRVLKNSAPVGSSPLVDAANHHFVLLGASDRQNKTYLPRIALLPAIRQSLSSVPRTFPQVTSLFIHNQRWVCATA